MQPFFIGEAMEKTGYICFMIILKMLGIKNDQKALEEKFMKIQDNDIAIIRIAKEMGLKVKAARFSERIFNKLTVPVIARCKDGRYILILGIHEDKCKILEPANGNPSSTGMIELCMPDCCWKYLVHIALIKRVYCL